MTIPKVVFKKIDIDSNIEIICWTYNEKDDKFNLKENTLNLFPKLEENQNINIVVEEQLKLYANDLEVAISKYKNIWDKYNNIYMQTLSQVLNIEWPATMKTITGKVGIVPICPRDLQKKEFTIPFWFNDDYLIDIVAHECCHLLYFEKWKQLFPNVDENQFESPNLIWELSEMVIDFILNKGQLKKIFNHRFKSYDYFYIDNIEEMNAIKKIYDENSIEEAIKKSYQYLLEKRRNINYNI